MAFQPSKVNLLLNASFETPEVEGNNSFAKDAIPNWALNESAILFKEFEGGYTYPGGPDTAHHGKQYLNINAFEGIAEQNFSLTSPAEVEFGGWFSGKDPTLGDDFFGNVFIVDNDDDGFSLGTIINSSDTLKKADFQTNKNWKSVAKKIVLPKGNFTFRLRMHVTANFDAAFVNIVKLYPAQAILWSGLVDNTWENPNNWFGGILPGPTSDVIIAGSKTIVVNSDVTIKSLTLRYGADFNANGGNLTILGY